ncbi:MAG: DUF4198 domain-containing protein, partial [Candidatus Eisenbacteria bacterium]|nr:DUF4198 domain-containing protein [Candidatus Eisenbacteria bacterium]
MSAILILSSFCAAGANAHEYWLTPSAFSAEQASVVAIHAFVGTGFDGELLPYAHQRTLRFVARADRDIDLAAHPVNGSVDFAYLKVPDDRGVLVAYGSTFTEIELPARKFEAYLAMEGLDGPRKERAARGEADLPGRERFARCPKTWIAAPKPDLGRLEKPVGLPLEIVALADPQSESTVPVRVLYHGDPLPDALVRAWNQSAT